MAHSACPTCVCVKPSTRRRILKVRANSRISSKSIPSTMFDVDCFIVAWPIVTSKGYNFKVLRRKLEVKTNRDPQLSRANSEGKVTVQELKKQFLAELVEKVEISIPDETGDC